MNTSTCTLSYTPTAVDAGYVAIGAKYGGDSNHSASTAPAFTLTVSGSTPILTTLLSSTSIPVDSYIIDQAMLTGGYPSTGVTGFVEYDLFKNGTCSPAYLRNPISVSAIGPGDTVRPSDPLPMLQTGNYSFDAAYFGDGNNNAVTSPCEPFTVTATGKDFSLTVNTSRVTLPAGSTVTDTINVTSLDGFTGSVVFTGSINLRGITVTFEPSIVVIRATGGIARSTVKISAVPTVTPADFFLVVVARGGSVIHLVAIDVNVTIAVPRLGHLSWSHQLSSNDETAVSSQRWRATVFNPQKSLVNVLVRIMGISTTNQAVAFDIVCGKICVATSGGSVETTPGVRPVSIEAGQSARLKFDYHLGSAFRGQTVRFIATLYWETNTSYVEGNSISGLFSVEIWTTRTC
jgi:hypothetical protein